MKICSIQLDHEKTCQTDSAVGLPINHVDYFYWLTQVDVFRNLSYWDSGFLISDKIIRYLVNKSIDQLEPRAIRSWFILVVHPNSFTGCGLGYLPSQVHVCGPAVQIFVENLGNRNLPLDFLFAFCFKRIEWKTSGGSLEWEARKWNG